MDEDLLNKELKNSNVEENDVLDEFIVDENEPADKEMLASIMKPYIKSIGKNSIVDYSEEFHKLPSWKKILIYLCCMKVMHIKGIVDKEDVGPKGISEGALIGESAAKKIAVEPTLKKLVKKEGEGYILPNYKLKEIQEVLLKNE